MSTIITHRQFPHYHKYTMDLAGRPLTLEVGKLAELARPACCAASPPRPVPGTASTSSP